MINWRRVKSYLSRTFIRNLRNNHPIVRVSLIIQMIDCLGAYSSGTKASRNTFSDFCLEYIVPYGQFGAGSATTSAFQKLYHLFRDPLAHNAAFFGRISVGRSQVLWSEHGILHLDERRLYEAFRRGYRHYFRDVSRNRLNKRANFNRWHIRQVQTLRKLGLI